MDLDVCRACHCRCHHRLLLLVKANGGQSTSYKRFPDAEEKELELIAAMVGVGVVLWGNSVVFTAETLDLQSWKREGKGTFMKVTFSQATSLLLENIQIVEDYPR